MIHFVDDDYCALIGDFDLCVILADDDWNDFDAIKVCQHRKLWLVLLEQFVVIVDNDEAIKEFLGGRGKSQYGSHDDAALAETARHYPYLLQRLLRCKHP